MWLLVGLLAPVLGQAQSYRTLRLMTADDVGIAAAYYPVAGTNVPATVLVHGFGQSRDEWNAFAPLLQHNGIAALTLDLRGHGQSTRKVTETGPQVLDHKTFGAADYPTMLLDINAAVDWLMEQPEVDRKRLTLMGAGIGANLCLRYSLVNEDVAAIVLLSPGMSYKGLRIDDVMRKLGRVPLRVVVSQRDNYSYESSKALMQIRKEEGKLEGKELIVCTGDLFGTELVKGVKDLPAQLIPWLRNILFGEPLPEPPPAPAPPPPPPAPPAKSKR